MKQPHLFIGGIFSLLVGIAFSVSIIKEWVPFLKNSSIVFAFDYIAFIILCAIALLALIIGISLIILSFRDKKIWD
ncbi:hypothetical protein K9M50_01525 [Patescibacteria group bacterium]|nr:hypothetical protein [Patescibacteria group bacterium]